MKNKPKSAQRKYGRIEINKCLYPKGVRQILYITRGIKR